MLAPGSKVSSRLICECKARRLIGRNIPLPTPGRKGNRADPDSGHSQSGPLQLILNLLGALKPRVVGHRQLVGVAEQPQQSRIVGTGIPRQRRDRMLFAHGLLIEDLATERSIRDIARSHEAVIDTAPAVAIPAAAATARYYIFKVTVAVVLTDKFPRERR